MSLHHTRNHEWTGADDIHPSAVEHKKITRGIGLSVAGSIRRCGDLRQRGKHQHSQSTPWPNFMIRGGTDILSSRGTRLDLALALRDCHQTDERALLVQLQVRTNAGSEDLMEAAAADSDLRGSRTREKVTQRPSVRTAAGPLLSSPLAPPLALLDRVIVHIDFPTLRWTSKTLIAPQPCRPPTTPSTRSQPSGSSRSPHTFTPPVSPYVSLLRLLSRFLLSELERMTCLA